MKAKVGFCNLRKKWEASVYWMERDGCRIAPDCFGENATDAVQTLYRHFKWLQREGWKRTR